MPIGKNIRYLRHKNGWSQEYLATQLGYRSYTTIQKWESGVSEPPFKKLQSIANLFQITLSDLTDDELPNTPLYPANDSSADSDFSYTVERREPDPEALHQTNSYRRDGTIISPQWNSLANILPYESTLRIPILGEISAGLPLYAEEHIEGYTTTSLNGGAEYFALRVKGDSMTAARIFEGDILIVRRQECVENGEIAVIMVGDESATVKCFSQHGTTVILEPRSLNPEHRTQIYDLNETTIRILGKVVQNQISF